MSLNARLAKLRLRDWVALGLVLGFIFGIAEGVLWLVIARLGAPRILWAAPLVDCTIAVAIVLTGAALARVLRVATLRPVFLFLACLLVYEPVRVGLKAPISKFTVLGLSLALAILLTEAIAHTVERRREWYGKGAVVAVAVIAMLMGATELRSKMVEAAAPVTAPASAKNVLVIVVDTLRADHLSMAGYSRRTTPNLDRIAKGGVVFDNAIASSSWTLPSHASLLTGMYPSQHHAETQYERLGAEVPVVSEWFREHGYRTAGLSANRLYFSRRVGFGEGFNVFRDVYPPLLSLLVTPKAGEQIRELLFKHGITDNLAGRIPAETMNRLALNWMDAGQGPFFAVINYFDVHDPYVPPREYRGRFGGPESRVRTTGVFYDEFPKLTPTEVQGQVNLYDESIAYTDDQIGALLQEMEKRGWLENTIVVITSDHGEEFDEHGFLAHANALYTELVHVPLIVVAPGKAPAGTHVATPVSLTNIPATVIDLAMGEKSEDFAQRSLATLWRDPTASAGWPAPRSELAELHVCQCFPNYAQSFRSVTTGEWQYIAGSKGEEQLFHVTTDPTNLHNVIGSAPPEAVEQMRRSLGAGGQ